LASKVEKQQNVNKNLVVLAKKFLFLAQCFFSLPCLNTKNNLLKTQWVNIVKRFKPTKMKNIDSGPTLLMSVIC